MTWDKGERDVRAVERYESPQRFDRLCHGLRLGVLKHNGASVIELRQARMKGPDWSNLFKATLTELNAGAATDVAAALHSAHATEIGTRADVLDDAGRRSNYLCATFPKRAKHVPVVAYTLTRVLPVLHKIPAT